MQNQASPGDEPPPPESVREPASGGILELLALAVPLVVSQGCETLMMFTDRLFLARVGPEYMAAAMSGGLTAFMLTTFFVGLVGYTNALVAQYYGAKQPRMCGLVAGQALIICGLSYPLLIASIPVGQAMFRFMGVPDAQLVPQSQYFSILMVGSIVALVRGALGSFFSGVGLTRIVMISAVVSLVVNVAAAYVLIFGKLGAPALGMLGAGIGVVFADLCGLVLMIVAYVRPSHRYAHGTVAGLRWHVPTMTKLLRLGAPAGIELFLNLVAFNTLVMLFHSRGPAVAAAVTVAFNWDMVSFVPLIGVNVGVGSLVGRYMGAGQPDHAHQATMSALKVAVVYTSIIIVTYSLAPSPLVRAFILPTNHAAWQIAIFMVRFVSVYVLADGLTLVFGGALRGAGDTFATMCISVSAHWFLLLATFVMLRWFAASPEATWLVLVLLIWCLAGVLFLRYRTGQWRSLKVVEPAL